MVSFRVITPVSMSASYAGRLEERVGGEVPKTVELKLTEETYKKVLEHDVSFNPQIPLKGDPKYVKAMVYDYASDLLGRLPPSGRDWNAKRVPSGDQLGESDTPCL